MDDFRKHDPQDQNADKAELELEEIETVTGTAEVTPIEESSVNTDNDTAEDATAHTEVGVSNEQLEFEATLVDAAVEKKKNRESTSEKSKKAGEARKSEGKSEQPVAAKAIDPLRNRGKKYKESLKKLEKGKTYELSEAVELIKQVSYASFDATVEAHFKVKAEAIRGSITLPHGSGKTKKVAIVTDEILEQISNGKFDFEVLLAAPEYMPKLAKFAKVLGPKGLMPSPKSGTVTDKPEEIAKEIANGRMEYRADKGKIVHVPVGKVSFSTENLVANIEAMQATLLSAKIQSFYLTATMSPSVKVALS